MKVAKAKYATAIVAEATFVKAKLDTAKFARGNCAEAKLALKVNLLKGESSCNCKS